MHIMCLLQFLVTLCFCFHPRSPFLRPLLPRCVLSLVVGASLRAVALHALFSVMLSYVILYLVR